MTFLVLLAAVDLLWAMRIGAGKSVFGFGWHRLDLPLLGMANVLAVSGYTLLARRGGRPWLAAFVGGELIGSSGYVATLLAFPNLVTELDFYLREFEFWIVPEAIQVGIPGHLGKYLAFLALVTLIGTVVLATLAVLLGLLVLLAARGKIQAACVAVIVSVALISGWLTLRGEYYRGFLTHYEEICEALSKQAGDVTKELERLRSAGLPRGVRTEEEIKGLEGQIASYEAALAENRRHVEIYRRVVSRPWLTVEE